MQNIWSMVARKSALRLICDTFLLKPDNQFGFKKKDGKNISILKWLQNRYEFDCISVFF